MGLDGSTFVHQQGGTLHHAAGAAAGAETPAFAGESHQLLMMAVLAAYSKEAVFEATALEVVGEFLLHVVGQRAALRFQVVEKGRVVLLDNPVEQRRFWLVALVTGWRTGCKEPAGRGGWQWHVEVEVLFDLMSLPV